MTKEATTHAIEVRGVVKRYGDVTALDRLDLEVAQGAFFGLLGPNGAGKTTTVNVLATLARPDAGEARLLGRDVVAERARVRADVGIVFQESTLDPDLTAREHLDLYGRLYHLANRRARVGEMLALMGLVDEADRPVRGFSGGMKRRLEIARGLLHKPRVLFLDEPTLGLDVAARAGVWEHLRRLHADGATTIFLTTHYMEEADALCGQIAIVDRGRVVAEGAPDALKSALGGDVVRLTLERAGALDRISSVDGVKEVAAEALEAGEALRVTVADGPRRLAPLLDAVRDFGVVEVTLHRPTLEHVFLHHTGHAFEQEASE
jgi:ABC-2 type transport system ATP-binding protein